MSSRNSLQLDPTTFLYGVLVLVLLWLAIDAVAGTLL